MKHFFNYILIPVLLICTSIYVWALRPPKQITRRDGTQVSRNYNRDMQRIRVAENWASARGEDNDTPVGAITRIMAEKDTWEEWLQKPLKPQLPGLEYHADASVKGDAPNDYPHYGGKYHVWASARNKDGNRNSEHSKTWEGSIDHEDSKSEAKDKDRDANLDDVNYFDHLSECGATAWISGDYPENALQHGPNSGSFADARANQFSFNDTLDWGCYNCDGEGLPDPQCRKCGGFPIQVDLPPVPSPVPTPAPDPTPDPDDTPGTDDTDDEDTNNGGAVNTPSPGLSPTNGSNLAVGGETYELQLVAEENYYYVHWYVKSPSETGIGTEIEYDGDGYGGESEASFSYTFPYTTGDYVITARVYRFSDYTYYDETYTVTVW